MEDKKQRTKTQNKALHLYFRQLAESLNNAGYDMRKTLREDIEIPWTEKTIKEFLWKRTQEAYLIKKSTTELTTDEIDKVYEVLNRFIGEKTGIHIPFPSYEALLMDKLQNNDNRTKKTI